LVDKESRKIICVPQAEGRKHDYRLFKESKKYIRPATKSQVDTGYQGLQKNIVILKYLKKKQKNH
jgi:hypothetical protein